jgi:2-furoyl-CoA dehydrogenase FAD binding subunit
MKPPAFDYLKPATVEEALAALAEAGDEARLLAGGQSLMPMLNYRLLAPALLIDIGGLAALDRIDDTGATITVGAAVTQATLEAWPALSERTPLLAAALPWVGHYQTRSRGTVCGSIAHADPSAELPLCLVALGGTVRLRAQNGVRSVAASDFFAGALATARRAEEMIEAVEFPRRVPGAGYAFREVALRHGDFALVAVAAIATKDGLRLAVGGVADRPVARDFPLLSGTDLADALDEFAKDLPASADRVASAAYRRALVRNIGRQAAEEAIRCRA